MSSKKTCIVTFQIPNSDPLIGELHGIFGKSNHIAVVNANNEVDFLKALKEYGNALILTNIASKAHLQRSIGLFKTHAKMIKASLVRPVAILHTENKKIDRILSKYGCKDIMDPGLTGKTLKYKMDFWIKNIQRAVAKIEDLKKQRMAAAKKQEVQYTNKGKKDYIQSKQLDLASDIWIIDAENDIKKILKRYLIKAKGPSPYALRWVEMKRNPKDKFPTWKGIVEGDDSEFLVMDEGAWFFVGLKPEFDWNVNLWNFSSEAPHLFFYTQEKKVFSRFRYGQNGLQVAGNSDAAKQKKEVIESTFEKDVKKLEKLQRMQEAEQGAGNDDFGHLHEEAGDSVNPHDDFEASEPGLSDNEQLEVDPASLLSLEEEGGLNPKEQIDTNFNLLEAETSDSNPDMGDLLSEDMLGDKNSGNSDFDPDMYAQEKGSVNPHGDDDFDEANVARVNDSDYEGHYDQSSGSSSGSPFDDATQRRERDGMELEGKFNNKAEVLNDDVLSRERTEHINHEDLEGKAETDHLEHDPLSGRSSTDHLEHDPLSGRASTDEINGDPLSGRSYTDEIEADPLSGRSYTDEIDGDPLSGRSYTDEYGEDPLEGRAETDEIEGHMEGRSETEELEHNPLESYASTEELEHNPLEGYSGTEVTESGPLEGEAKTDHIEVDPLVGATYEDEGIPEEYEEYEDEDGQVQKRKVKLAANYISEENPAKQNHEDSGMEFDSEAEAEGGEKKGSKYDWDESLFDEEGKPKMDKDGAKYFRDDDEKAQNRVSEIEDALGGETPTANPEPMSDETVDPNAGSGSVLDIDLDEFLDADPGVNTESGKVMVIVNQTTKEGNELSIIAEFADYFEDEVTVNVPRDSLVSDAPVVIDLKMKYGKSKKRIKIKGEVLELENYDEEKDQLIVKAPNLNPEQMDEFMQMFAERQENIQDFMQKARGY